MPKTKPCMSCGVRPKMPGRHKCGWCYLETLPMMQQVGFAEKRLAAARAAGQPHRARVPEREWPAGYRWCAGCQTFVPLDYARGSRCRACASQASHASRVKATYSITGEEYAALFKWQGGRCYVCGKRTKKRLAVDHDHRTGEVRGLLCADNEWGCNVSLAIVLNDLEAARRLWLYVATPPIQRWRNGEAPPTYEVNGADQPPY